MGLTAQVRASSGKQLVSIIVLTIMLASFQFFLSDILLLHGDSVPVVINNVYAKVVTHISEVLVCLLSSVINYYLVC